MKNMRIIFAFTVCCAGLIALVAAFGLLDATTPYQQDSPFLAAISTPQQAQAKALTLLFVGDIMLDRGVEWEIQKNPPAGGGGDWTFPFHLIAGFLQEANLVFGNLESQISDKGRNVGSIYSFRADPKAVEALLYAGIDVVSVANNHSFDYTREAFDDSLQRLQEVSITAVADTLVTKEINDTKIGFLAYSNFPGPALADWNNMPEVLQNITRAKAQVDILVVSLHAGEEYQTEPNAFQVTFSQNAIQAGADITAGHHPHVVQPLERYRHGWIAYSLGNFVFDQNFSEETMKGAILKVIVKDKKIQEVFLLPTRLTSSYQVFLEE